MASIEIVRGDITVQQVDAIVNAANSSLLGGGGVDGAIHRVGGPVILEECRRIRATELPDGLPTGKAVATTAGRLPAAMVVHAVGPVWSKREDRSALLSSAFRESLRVARSRGARSVAFPAISAGVYGWPLADAARIGVETARDFLAAQDSNQDQDSASHARPIDLVRFVLFSDDAAREFRAALDRLGPL